MFGRTSPLRAIASHELTLARRSGRLRWIGATALAIAVLAQVGASWTHRRDAADRARVEARAQEEWAHQDVKSPHATNHFGKWILKPRASLAVLDRGVEDHVGQQMVLDAHAKTPLVASANEEDPTRALVGNFDLGFVVAVLLPLLVLVATHDAISGERERGTLKLALSHPVSRRRFLVAKALGATLVVGIGVLLPLLLSLAIAPLMGIPFERDDVLGVFGFAAVSALYLGFYVAAGLAVSASARSSAASLALAFVLWLGTCFLVPRLAVELAELREPPPSIVSLHESQAQIGKALEDDRKRAFEAAVARVRAEHPEVSADFASRSRGHGERPPSTWSVDPSGVFVTEANAMLNRERARRIAEVRVRADARERLAGTLASASPMTLFVRASSALARTDVESHRHFERQVDAFFDAFGAYFNALWARNVQELTDVQGAPSFRYRPEARADVFARFARAALGLLGFVVVASVAAGFRLRRYDAR